MKRQKTIINILLAILAIHLWFTHSKILYHLNPDKEESIMFFFWNYEYVYQVIAIITSLAYSLMTVAIISLFESKPQKGLMYTFCSLDAIGVFIYYFKGFSFESMAFNITGATYYGAYTFIIVYTAFFMNEGHIPFKGNLEKEIKRLKSKGYKQVEIANMLGTNQTKVSKTLKK
jgi:predicted XRE-type DNA-binding protein